MKPAQSFIYLPPGEMTMTRQDILALINLPDNVKNVRLQRHEDTSPEEWASFVEHLQELQRLSVRLKGQLGITDAIEAQASREHAAYHFPSIKLTLVN